MRKKILDTVRGLYFYYGNGATYRIPYFSTISALVVLVFIHLLQAGIFLKRFLNISINIFPMPDVHRGIKYLVMALYLAPIYWLLVKIFPAKKLKDHNLSDKELSRQRNIFFIYAIVNVLLILILIGDKITFGKR